MRISIRRDGQVSTHLHDQLLVGDKLQISGPFGSSQVVQSVDEDRPLVLLSAGIGITPTMAMLQSLSKRATERQVFVGHVGRNGSDLALWDEVKTALRVLPNAANQLYLTQASREDCETLEAIAGRPDLKRWVPATLIAEADIHICGPMSFLTETRDALIATGACPDRIHIEVFSSPRSKPIASVADLTQIPAGPFHVRFANSAVEAIWTNEVGTLLDLAERSGLAPPANCRSGACGTCSAKLLSGTVHHVPEPVMPVPAGTVLLCCARPLTDVQLA